MEALYKDILSRTADPKHVTIMGDSAGGGFTLGFAMYLRDHGLAQPKDLILVSPWLDLHTNNPAIPDYEPLDPLLSAWGPQIMGERWANGKDNLSVHYVSPLFGDVTGLGKLTIIAGSHEIMVPDIELFHDRLVEQGVAHNYLMADKMIHIYAILPIPEGKEAQAEIVKIIQGD